MADEFLQFWRIKSTQSERSPPRAPPPDFTCTNRSLIRFQPVTEQVVNKLIALSPTKSCDLDPAPTFVVKEFVDDLLPMLTQSQMCNASIAVACLPSPQNEAGRCHSTTEESRST